MDQSTWETQFAKFKTAIARTVPENKKQFVGNEELIYAYYAKLYQATHHGQWTLDEGVDNQMILTIELFTFLTEYITELYLYDKRRAIAGDDTTNYIHNWVYIVDRMLLQYVNTLLDIVHNMEATPTTTTTTNDYNLHLFKDEPYYNTFIATLEQFKEQATYLSSAPNYILSINTCVRKVIRTQVPSIASSDYTYINYASRI